MYSWWVDKEFQIYNRFYMQYIIYMQGRIKPISQERAAWVSAGKKILGPPPLKMEQTTVNFQFIIYYHILIKFSIINNFLFIELVRIVWENVKEYIFDWISWIYSIFRPSDLWYFKLVKVQYRSYHSYIFTYLIKGNNVGDYLFFFERFLKIE